MKTRRTRRNFSAGTVGMTAEDRKAVQAYSMNRRSTRYYDDLNKIDNDAAAKAAAARDKETKNDE
jgi:hypothetical protein